ncbi:MAG: radical SAM protein [Waddliaceae bacterium]
MANMNLRIDSTVMITTQCSAGCQHCPYSNPQLKKLFLNVKTVKQLVDENSKGKTLTVLSGGELFEHPKIKEILEELINSTGPFRIASGGFVDLSPWINQLRTLSDTKRSLQGISMGTDILSSRVNHSNWVPTWVNNIQLLSQSQISYSLTLSLPNDLVFSHFDIWRWMDYFDSKPAFIYILHHAEEHINELTKKIKSTFCKVPIIYDTL